MPRPDRLPVLAVGVGNPMRRDDGVGPAVIDRLRTCSDLPSTVELLILDGEPTRLIDAWHGRERVVVIDATQSGDPPGTIHRLDPAIVDIPPGRHDRSSHGAGVETAIDLATALDRLPEDLVILGVEPAELNLGTGLSPSVDRALSELVAQIIHEVTR